MRRTSTTVVGALAVTVALVTSGLGVSAAQEPPPPAEAALFTRGASGIGDPYFPKDGNGGYDVTNYGLELRYDPDTDVLEGVATIDARSTQNLSRFNLDFDGLTVASITVDGQPATFTRGNGELRITPAAGIPVRTHFETVVTYSGVPVAQSGIDEGSGWIPTDDGVLVVGQPHVASTWFPANDHPQDKATFDIAMSVPEGLEAVANGALVSNETTAGETRWVWRAAAPMATYLATVNVGEFVLDQYHDPAGRPDGVDYVDALDPDLSVDLVPRTGTQFAYSQIAQDTYKRLRRNVTVPPEGATLTFWVDRDTESDWDFFFVEARRVGQRDWTTLPDGNGHTSQDTGSSCPYWLGLHPFLGRYQTPSADGGCLPTGTTGSWNAVSGHSDGWEQWSIDLGAYAGGTAQVAITYASDDSVQNRGVAVDDLEVSTGEGTTSFEDDGDPMDDWTVPGAPQSSGANTNDWTVITEDAGPPPFGEVAQGVLDRQPEIVGFLAGNFGDYPFADSGAIIDDVRDVGFALENQTRPVYAPEFFSNQEDGEAVVVHELAHQWYGDKRALPVWKHIWLNEGFATYAEWLWAEHDGGPTAQDTFEDFYSIPGGSPFWDLDIGNPGPSDLFDSAVYYRGAMALHALRLEIGDADFFTLIEQWAAQPNSVRVTTRNFTALAEGVSGEELSGLIRDWVRTTSKPALSEAASEATAAGTPPHDLSAPHRH